MIPAEKSQEMLAFLRSCRPAMLRLLKRFVLCESPTDSKPAVDHFGRLVAAEWKKRGAKIELFPEKRAGNHVRGAGPQSSRTGPEFLPARVKFWFSDIWIPA